jgi:endoglucanase
MGLPDLPRRKVLVSLAGCAAGGIAAAAGFGAPRTAPPVGAARAPLPTVWRAFRRRFVTADGRVLDDDGSTHSEALGTALLGAVAASDGERFAQVWAFASRLQRDDGLISWRWQQGGRIIDANNATDGDLYIAWALARAVQAFDPAYGIEARRVARAIRIHCVRDTRYGPVLVPGRSGFDRSAYVVANPSYWVFPAFGELQAIDPHPQWRRVEHTALNLLAESGHGRYGLAPDWLEVDESVRPWRERPARFGYEAIRVPLFLYWAQHTSHPQLAAFARYAAVPGFAAWIALDSDERAVERAPAGFEAIARLARSLPGPTRVSIPHLDSSYYSSSLSLMAAIANDDTTRNGSTEHTAGNPPR